MSVTQEAEQELNAMLDDGVSVELVGSPAGEYLLRVAVTDAGCAECLVPDDMLEQIAAEALRRRGATVSSVAVEHAS